MPPLQICSAFVVTIAPPPIFPDGVVAYRVANGTRFMPAWKSVLSPAQIWDLVHFSDRLTALRFVLYVACAVVGIVVASRARPGANGVPEQRPTA